ncbi:Glycosyltransferase involved in cell wall bisynthesis [Chitinophaga ginsengisegetis]|uniref:Glycosyltransferase involved in cell wall bisynthesis n=1 Tax=Chitinophaga ginsengisegetis TaxID=393003 RepID=A0A1T5NY06_9BACT|nr:glycosyltransferase family 2 protein [Chitinophaga ginsengisegetis]MDR6567278.1 glycosyltransferase involved in cell wall biosynthesis [Chitinophaga ginsengisegetis]MDR6647008.1 glycosyltransferase involved in cell wall biosynthesis [Chitinophaga ginsengisegetis]MDR6653358.1 glycosyltransferase involved in cell wall biosynthesis [Chitinophaga ginsengisegetis]SKD04979.1 Glycosyltransferase involved in cell wall bisynthesis [Chitinophaga ginsengisegetis]
MKIAVVILTFNESLHLARCLENLRQITDELYVIDAFSTDDTVAIAERFGAKVFQRKWVNYANQFQWALDHCGIETPWVMRMDADEYLEPGLVKEIRQRIDKVPAGITGIYIRRKVLFKGKWIRFGGFYPHTLLRIWRNGVGSIEQRWMDEHIVLSDGATMLFKEHIVDDNLNSIHWWVNKHNNYAIREMVDLLNIRYGFWQTDERLLRESGTQAKRKRFLKEKVYASMSPGMRASLYFLFRYVVRYGFLDGYKGFLFHFMQGYWYRLLVDVNVQEFQQKLDGNESREDIMALLKQDYNIHI